MARSGNRKYDQAETKPSCCKKCRSTRHTAYFGTPEIKTFDFVQLRPDGTEFTRLIRRRTKCQDCGQFRFDLSYEYVPDDLPTAKPIATQRRAAGRKPAVKMPEVQPPQSAPTFLGAAEQT